MLPRHASDRSSAGSASLETLRVSCQQIVQSLSKILVRLDCPLTTGRGADHALAPVLSVYRGPRL
jgi:hypothetical protein